MANKKKYDLVIESQDTEYDSVEHKEMQVSFATIKELHDFVEDEIMWYKENAFMYISIDVYEADTGTYITSVF